MINRFLIIFIILSLVGCAYKSTSEIMNSWMGSHISQVIQSWGPPTQIAGDGAGGKIYIWRPQEMPLPSESSNGTAYEQLQATYRRMAIQIHNERYKMFYVRPNGTVYHGRAQ